MQVCFLGAGGVEFFIPNQQKKTIPSPKHQVFRGWEWGGMNGWIINQQLNHLFTTTFQLLKSPCHMKCPSIYNPCRNPPKALRIWHKSLEICFKSLRVELALLRGTFFHRFFRGYCCLWRKQIYRTSYITHLEFYIAFSFIGTFYPSRTWHFIMAGQPTPRNAPSSEIRV